MAKKNSEWTQKKRRALLNIHGTRCWICGKHMPESDCTLDHVIPRWLFPCDELWNLRLAHRHCNNERSNGAIGRWFREAFERRWRRVLGD